MGGRQWRNIGDRTTPPYHHPGSGRANFCLFVEGSGRAMCLIAGIAPRPDDFLGSVFDMLVLDIFRSTGRFMIFALVPRSRLAYWFPRASGWGSLKACLVRARTQLSH